MGGAGHRRVVLIGVLVWRDPLSIWQILGIVLVVAGAVMLNVFTPSAAA